MSTAIVTGGSGGIGRATARALGDEHAVLVQYYRDEAGAEATVSAVTEAGGEAAAHQCDVADPAAAEAMVDRAREQFGPVDVLVNNAGMFLQKGLFELSNEELDRVLAVNLTGAVYCTRAALPDMLDGNGGHVVNVASGAGTRGSATDPIYSASKGGLIAFTKTLARHYTADGVISNVVAPGPVDTPMFAEERRDAARERLPIGRLIQPEEIADAIRFFATTTATSGKVLEIDGGSAT